MKLTTKGRYAVTALVDMAIRYGLQRPVTISELSDRQSISQTYLEQLTGVLRAKGILVSVKGPGGGYLLAKSPDLISIAEIITAVNEPVDSTRCAGKHNCQQGKICLTHTLWEELNNTMQTFLQNKTLGELARSHDIRQVATRQMGKPIEWVI
jgi:Rrf2 family iron-sulfur cluster assembly transcriptional regulator